jgi:hypothetical protein
MNLLEKLYVEADTLERQIENNPSSRETLEKELNSVFKKIEALESRI